MNTEKNLTIRCNYDVIQKFADIATKLNAQTKGKAFEIIVNNFANSEDTTASTEATELLTKQLQQLQDVNIALTKQLQEKTECLQNNSTELQKITELENEITKLVNSKQTPENAIILQDYIFEILKLVTERVNKYENKNFAPSNIIETYITEYNIKGNRYFHDFYINRKDLVNIKNQLENK